MPVPRGREARPAALPALLLALLALGLGYAAVQTMSPRSFWDMAFLSACAAFLVVFVRYLTRRAAGNIWNQGEPGGAGTSSPK